MAALTAIRNAFVRATLSTSRNGFMVTKDELHRAVKAAKSDDGKISRAEKRALADGYMSASAGEYYATQGARTAYASLQKELGLPGRKAHG